MHYCSPSHVLSFQKDTILTKYQLYQQVTHHFLHVVDHFQYDLKSNESLLQRNMEHSTDKRYLSAIPPYSTLSNVA